MLAGTLVFGSNHPQETPATPGLRSIAPPGEASLGWGQDVFSIGQTRRGTWASSEAPAYVSGLRPFGEALAHVAGTWPYRDPPLRVGEIPLSTGPLSWSSGAPTFFASKPGDVGTSSFNAAPSQVKGEASPGATIPSISARFPTSSFGAPLHSGPTAWLISYPASSGTSTQIYQASREDPSGLTLRLAPMGDVNLDLVVDTTDLILVTRALGTALDPDWKQCLTDIEELKDIDVKDCVNFLRLAVDLNADNFVDVEDLAIVAAHLGERSA